MKIEMEPTLEQALRLHPQSRRVAVVAGKSRTDAYWAAEARKAFRRLENQVEFVYLVGLPMSDLLREAAHLPEGSIVYYLHVFEDGLGETFIPAEVVEYPLQRLRMPPSMAIIARISAVGSSAVDWSTSKRKAERRPSWL